MPVGPINASDQTKTGGDTTVTSSVQQSGQHGQFLNFVFGHGNTQTPTNTDSSGSLGWKTLAAAGAVGVLVWLILRRKKGAS